MGKYGTEKTPYLDTFHAEHEKRKAILSISILYRHDLAML